MLRGQQIHWRTPVLTLSALTAGISLVVAHYVFNSLLNNTAVTTTVYMVVGLHVSQQQLYTATGTTLAFLSRACFVVALSSAYTQQFWLAAARDGRRTRAATLDVMYSVLDNLWNLFHVSVWWNRPFLLLTALICWLLPIASVVTPATLSVVVVPVSPLPSTLVRVPQADFSSVKLLAAGQANNLVGAAQDNWNTVIYNGPTYTVQWIALAAAVSGSISSIAPPSQNASWTVGFHGPSLSCDNMNNTMYQQVQRNIVTAYVNGSYCQQPYNFMAWTPSAYTPWGTNSTSTINAMPFPSTTPFTLNGGTLGPLDYDSLGPNGTSNSTSVATIYFAAIPNLAYEELGECWTNPNATNLIANTHLQNMFVNSTFLECQLYNASYQANFTYVNGEQNIVVQRQQLNAIDIQPGFCMPLYGANSPYSSDAAPCTIDPTTLQRMSYQSIMDAFGRVFVGTVLDGERSHYRGSTINATSVMSTVLLNTAELSFLQAPSDWESVYGTVGAEMQSLYDWTPNNFNASLKTTLEELFQNITLSMFSSDHLQPNASSPFAPPLVNVTVHDFHNVYAFAVEKFWLAYGLAIGFTMLGIGLGAAAMMTNGASFSKELSTILRATRHADISVDIKDSDGDGKDPLPKELGEAKVVFEGGIWNRRTRSYPTTTGRQAQSKGPNVRIIGLPSRPRG